MNQAMTLFIFIAIFLHPFWLYFLVIEVEMGVTGIAIASSITFTTEFILVLLYEFYWVENTKPLKKILIAPTSKELKKKDLWELFVFGFYCF